MATRPVTPKTATHSRPLPRKARSMSWRRVLGSVGRTGKNSTPLRTTRSATASSTVSVWPWLSMSVQPRLHTSARGEVSLEESCVTCTYLGVPSRRCQPASRVMGRARALATAATAAAGSRPLSTSSAARSNASSVRTSPAARAAVKATKSCSDCAASATMGGRSCAPTAVVSRSTPL